MRASGAPYAREHSLLATYRPNTYCPPLATRIPALRERWAASTKTARAAHRLQEQAAAGARAEQVCIGMGGRLPACGRRRNATRVHRAMCCPPEPATCTNPRPVRARRRT